MRDIDNMIFDWSGTLSNSVESFRQVCDLMFVALGRAPISLDEIRQEFTIPYMVFWNKYFPDLTKEAQDKLFRKCIAEVDSPKIYDGVKETLSHLDDLHIRMGVLSSDLYSTLLPEITKSDLHNFFMEIKAEVHEKGPALVNILKKHNFDPVRTMYVGDTSGDIDAGKFAGVVAVGVSWGYQCEDKLNKSNPDYLIKNISELCSLINAVP